MSHKILKPLSIEERANFIVEYNHNQGLLIEETETAMYALEPWEKLEGDEVIDNTEAWKEKQAQKERERLNLLSMTKREMFLGLYQAKGITPDMLKAQITDPQALIEFEYANDYYRGNPLIDVIGTQLGFTSEQLDKFFETKDYTTLLPQSDIVEGESDKVSDIVTEQVEVQDENTTDTTESDVQDELDTTTSKPDEIDTDILE